MKVFLAGIYGAIPYLGPNSPLPAELERHNCFTSFYYKNGSLQAVELTQPKGLRVCDSGAFTFLVAANRAESVGATKKELDHLESPYEFFKRYVKWIQDNYDTHDYFVEFDISPIVGYPQVERWRKEYVAAGIADKMIWVYHDQNTFKEYQAMVDTAPSRYVAIPRLEGAKEGLQGVLLRYAYEQRCRVHGLAMVKRKALNQYPFYSADSTTWLSPIKFARFGTFDESTGAATQIALKAKGVEDNWKHLPVSLLNDFSRITGTGGATATPEEKHLIKGRLLAASAVEYYKLQNYYTRLWKARGVDWAKQLGETP